MAGLSVRQRTPTLSYLRGERKCSQLKEKFENGIWKTRYVQYRGQVWQITSMARPLSKRSQPSRDLQWHKKQKTVSQKESFTQYGRDFWKTAKYQKLLGAQAYTTALRHLSPSLAGQTTMHLTGSSSGFASSRVSPSQRTPPVV